MLLGRVVTSLSVTSNEPVNGTGDGTIGVTNQPSGFRGYLTPKAYA